MSLRLLQIATREEERNIVEGVVAASTPLARWTQTLADDTVLICAVVESQACEALQDEIQHHLEQSMGDYRIVVLPVESTLPRARETDETPEDPEVAKTPDRVSRAELLEDLTDGLKTSPRYFLTVLLSSVVASVGLLRDDLAIVIGAMVIAPLLTPNAALALATTLGDLDMVRRSLRTNAYGIVTALSFAIAVGAVMDVDATIPAIASRAVVSGGDVVLALAAGTAGALAFTTGLPTSLVGVMVAVALLPPTVVAGLLIGSQQMELAFGSLLLLSVNVICVNLSGVLTFWSQGLRPRSWWEAEKGRRATRIALVLWTALLALLLALISLSGNV